ncbi:MULTISPECIES: ankyrin repeat domain-containing protein [unclassified Oceanispirochaeta]|uniref:ankyrin repeat domain-containing protein n=1 Tax=unclassified Oceanispirochaeta TaxID=2635722 RepID=UPI000E093266|nr:MULTISPECIES: ankyrin repeat domain-containing protein [unclassified Oceanispirochaeta]MBF9017479.1 ankyrin repeat domain-containing protein [Oceanispirochaeta sp. M2]NPD74051.1 ankyrin repeat domain-containing protein [Oceanispirochaeta sp. M1]RDG30093.1 ankyrin repeat domain-containing protein [Oceanispirochaeta sp. M1]
MKNLLLYILIFILTFPLFATPEEDFLAALRDSRLQDARFFLDSDNSVDQVIEDGNSALIIMCDEQRSHEVRWLMSQGADPNQTDSLGQTPLMYAAMKGNRNIIQILLQEGAILNLQSPMGYTALQMAVNHGQFETAADLEARGANIIEGYYDHPALSEIWSRRQHYAVALALKESRWKYHDFLKAVVSGDYRVIRNMIDTGTDPNAADTEGVTALMLTASAPGIYQAELLLSKGADPALLDSMGLSALWYGAFRNNLPMVELLLEAGVVDDAPYLENSALFGAFSSGAHEAMVMLIEAGWNAGLTGRLGTSLVHYAAFTGDLRTLKELKEAGISLLSADAEGNTAQDYLIQGFHLNEQESLYIPVASYLKSEEVSATTDPSVLDNMRLSRIIYSKW